MSSTGASKGQQVFTKELEYLKEAKALLNNADNNSPEVFKEAYGDLCSKYEKLVRDTKLITKVSDRLHHKLDQANAQLETQSNQIQEMNNDLTVSNQILKDTIDQLVKAKVSKKATSIVLLIAVLLFILSEGLIEPYIESFFEGNDLIGFATKGGIALLLRPIDIVVERYLMSKTINQAGTEAAIEEGNIDQLTS